MIAPKKAPGLGQRMRTRWPMTAWYFDVARGIPKAAWSAIDLAVTLVGVAAIGATLAGSRELDVSWAVVVTLVLFLYYVLRLNYLKVADLQAQYAKDVSWHWDQMKKALDRDIRSYKFDRFKELFGEGADMIKGVANAPDDHRTEWVKKVDAWVAAVERFLKDDVDDLAYFKTETGVPSAETEWRGMLYEFLYLRLDRFGEVWRRATQRD